MLFHPRNTLCRRENLTFFLLSLFLVCAVCFSFLRCCVVKGELPPTINYDTPDPECDLRIFKEKVKVDRVKGALSSNLVRKEKRKKM